MSTIRKQGRLTEVTKAASGDRSFDVTLYDATVPDRDGETLDVGTFKPAQRITLQIDHDWSVEKTVGWCDSIHWEQRKLRGTMTFAPAGVSDLADQMFRQVTAGITATVSIGFRGDRVGNVYENVEVYELSLVSVPASPGARVDGKAMRAWLGRGASDDPVLLRLVDDRPGKADDVVVRIVDDGPAYRRSEPFGDPAMVRALLSGIVYDLLKEELTPSTIRAAVELGFRRARGRVD